MNVIITCLHCTVATGKMKSFKSFNGARGGLTVLPTLEEDVSDAGSCSSDSSMSSLSDQHHDTTDNYPEDLLGMSWGSYLNSGPPTRTGGQLRTALELGAADGGEEAPQDSSPKAPSVEAPNEPHPLLQHLEGLMTTLIRSKKELVRFGIDVSPLTPLCNATLTSHNDLKQMVKSLSLGGTSCNNTVITSDLVHNLVEFLRGVLNGLTDQGKKLSVQTAFLQQTARQLSRSRLEWEREQSRCQEEINKARRQLDLDRRELQKQGHSIRVAEEELKRILAEAEEAVNHGRKRKGRMASPHSVAQGRTQLAALIQTQKQQSRLEKSLTQQQRDIRHLQQAHDFTKSELLTVQDHAEKLQRKLVKKIHEVKSSESALASQMSITQESMGHPSMALDKEKRKSYHNTSKAQVKATLKGISAAQKTLSTEIERMQRQFSEQNVKERRISRQLEESGRLLLETDTRLKEHTVTIKGVRKSSRNTLDEEGQLASQALDHDKPQRKDIPQSRSVSLPKIDPPNLNPMRAAGKPKRLSQLPRYQFSKTELFTLAKFDDHETAEQVMQWLQLQGKLKK